MDARGRADPRPVRKLLVLLDVRMPHMDGLACLDQIRARHPAVKVVMLSASSNPELVEAALREEAEEVRAHPADAHLCSNRTCEIGLSQVTGEAYESFVFALDEATRVQA